MWKKNSTLSLALHRLLEMRLKIAYYFCRRLHSLKDCTPAEYHLEETDWLMVFLQEARKGENCRAKKISCFTERASQFTGSLVLMEDLNFTVLWRSYGDLEVTKVWGDPPASRGLRKHLFLCWHCTLGHANLCPGHGLGPANQSRRRRSGMNSHLVCWRIPVTWLPLALAPGAICGAPSWLPSSGLSHCCPLQKSIPARIKSEVQDHGVTKQNSHHVRAWRSITISLPFKRCTRVRNSFY